MKRAILVATITALCGAMASATPANKAALGVRYGRFLPARLDACSTCHQSAPGTKPGVTLDEFPHNPFGARLKAIAVQLRQSGQRTDLGRRLEKIAGEDWFTNIGTCADDLAIVRSLWTLDNDHGAQLTFQTGRHVREGAHPTVGSWACYGLGTLNENLPEYVVLGTPTGDCCGGAWTHGASYLGPQYAGVKLSADPKKPLPFLKPADNLSADEQAANFSLMGRLNQLAGIDYPDDKDLQARIKAYELAFQMQTSVPETLQLEKESAETRALYGLDQAHTKAFGEQCLAARRLVERGVRFIQLFHGGGGGGAWDAHSDVKGNHTTLAAQVDKPIAGLLKDLKRRGLLDETLVVFGTEFGRTPGAEGTGRDHHPQGFCAWLAGGGIKGGITHGATDELGFHAVESPHYLTDLHATVLHQLGLDSRKLEVPGRKRLEIDHGQPIREILA
ncbi:DUF1501 domain-containing protein [Armatimonas sp.]|uniref:DUF1501 domain-containing protein n=1 Tax=Armatimonas sp. TaxID=1872638 RepID=UPI00375324F7